MSTEATPSTLESMDAWTTKQTCPLVNDNKTNLRTNVFQN